MHGEEGLGLADGESGSAVVLLCAGDSSGTKGTGLFGGLGPSGEAFEFVAFLDLAAGVDAGPEGGLFGAGLCEVVFGHGMQPEKGMEGNRRVYPRFTIDGLCLTAKFTHPYSSMTCRVLGIGGRKSRGTGRFHRVACATVLQEAGWVSRYDWGMTSELKWFTTHKDGKLIAAWSDGATVRFLDAPVGVRYEVEEAGKVVATGRIVGHEVFPDVSPATPARLP